MQSVSEENHLKAIFKIAERNGIPVATNSIAKVLDTTAASVTDMLKKLADKSLINYEKYRGASLTSEGVKIATELIRRHRLWETFLVDHLGFSWDEVHVIAEQLEHVQSDKLIDRLDDFLGHPRFDPHGDPIPDRDGKFVFRKQSSLETLAVGDRGIVVSVQNHEPSFLNLLNELDLKIGTKIAVLETFDFKSSMKVAFDGGDPVIISSPITQDVHVKKI